MRPGADSRRRGEWAELVDAHGGAAWALVRRMCRHQQDAEDAFQEMAARAWKHWPGAAALGNPRAWLMTIAYRACLDQRTKARSCAALGGLLDEALVEATDERELRPLAAVERQDDAHRVGAALRALPEEIREVFVLHYTGGLSLKETAAVMGIKVGTVKSRLSTGLKQLRRGLPSITARPVLPVREERATTGEA